MEGHERTVARRDDRWWLARLPAAATGLVLVERVLIDGAGSPVALLRALGDLGHAWAEPVTSVLALIALLAETLVAYLLVVLLLHSLGMLPGFVGRLAGRVMSPVTPAVVQRLLDLLVGGALLTQVALAATPGAPQADRWNGSHLGPAASLPVSGSVGPATLSGLATTGHGEGRYPWPVDVIEPAGARPTPRRSAVPLPPWLGGGPSNAAPAGDDEEAATLAPRHGAKAGRPTAPRQRDKAGDTTAHGHTVEVGDTLWDIAAARLAPAERSAANIHRYWRQLYRANRSAIGPDPDLIHPGTRLDVPPFRGAGR
jgi:LysM domain